MIELITTAESVTQAEALITAGVDTLYIGEDNYGLRLPASFSRDEVKEITRIAHENGKRIIVAVNAIMHNDRIEKVIPYLQFLQEIGVDSVTVGDPGVIHLMKKNEIGLSYIYDAQTLVTSARQINFWAKRGAVGAVLARELTFEELQAIALQVTVPVELLVYGATCIHHSKRPLVENYFNYTEEEKPEARGVFISEPKKPDTHYSIYEDINGTHVFNTNDINLMPYLDELVRAGLNQWKLDGIYTSGDAFIAIAKLFINARQAIKEGCWTQVVAENLNEQLVKLHPKERTLDTGFFLKDPDEVK